MYESCDGPELFFSFCGVVIVAIWMAAEAARKVNGWLIPFIVGIIAFILYFVVVFRPIDRVPAILQGLVLGAITGFGVYRLYVLTNQNGDSRVSAFAFGILAFLFELIWMTRLKSEIS